MQLYISILGSINVSPYKFIKMDALCLLHEDLGLINVPVFTQTGVVIFQSKPTEQIKLKKKITIRIAHQFSFKVPVIVMNIEELTTIVRNNPFINDTEKNVTFSHVTFLSKAPAKHTLIPLNI